MGDWNEAMDVLPNGWGVLGPREGRKRLQTHAVSL